MAFTREFIRSAAKESGVEIPKELEDALVQEHLSARDAFSEGKVKAALEENKPEPAPKAEDTEEYKALKQQFDAYKAEISARDSKSAKEGAARAYYQGKGITGKALEVAMRGSGPEIAALELDGDGKIRDAGPLDSLIAGDFSGLVSKTRTQGAKTDMPPANTGGGMSKAEIYKKDEKGRYVLDATARQEALAKMMSAAPTGE